jgi:hypothetical protein
MLILGKSRIITYDFQSSQLQAQEVKMKTFIQSAGSALLLFLIASAIMLAGCGGGGGGGSDTADPGGGTASQTGTAALLLRDAPADEYDSIILCANKVTLEPGAEVIFEAEDGCAEIDLLDHQEKPFLLNVKEVPARTYSQIRMTVDYIRTEGGACDELDVKLPSGVIKINPQGGIPIKSGDKVVIDVDVKAKQSVNIHDAGKSGKCIFRPVIIAEVRTVDELPPGSKCPRILHGAITAIKKDNGNVAGFKLKLSHSKFDEVNVRVNQDTVVFDEDGNFTDPNSLKVGQPVKVRGELLKDLSILSSVVAIGKLINLHGTALTAVDAGLKFRMKLDPGQEAVGEINVVVDNQTIILIDCNTEVDMDAIKPGTGIRAIGKISEGDLVAVALFLEEQKNYGTIEAMKDTGSGYSLEFTPADEGDSVTIFLPYSAVAKIEGDGGIGKDLLAELVNCTPRKARIVLNEFDDTVADLVEVRHEMTGGRIKQEGIDKKLERITLDSGKIIQVQEYATILKDNEPVGFSSLKDGDDITVFGLEDCEDDKDGVDFYGFVIIVENIDNGNGDDDDDQDN